MKMPLLLFPSEHKRLNRDVFLLIFLHIFLELKLWYMCCPITLITSSILHYIRMNINEAIGRFGSIW